MYRIVLWRELPILRWSLGELEYLADNAGKLLVARLAALHKPDKQILIFAQHEPLKTLSIRLTELRVSSGYKGLKHQIQLQHAAAGGPAHSVYFFAFDHASKSIP
jgi:hypothetical protein